LNVTLSMIGGRTAAEITMVGSMNHRAQTAD